MSINPLSHVRVVLICLYITFNMLHCSGPFGILPTSGDKTEERSSYYSNYKFTSFDTTTFTKV